MILEEETKEAFGYYAKDLTHGSEKRILAACDECGKVRILKKHHYHALCGSCSQKGDNSYNYGKKGEDASAFKGGKIRCICETCGKKFEVYSCRIKRGGGKYCCNSCAAKARIHNTKPLITAPEKAFDAICIKNNLPFKFVGDGALWLGSANPDFIHDTKKIVVEVFGNYFHSVWLGFKRLIYKQTVEGRTKQLKAEGYKCIVIWESDLMREDAEAFVMQLMYKENIIRNSVKRYL